MRILVACQHYWPEPFNTADVCEGLVSRGHEVAVLTGLPNTGMPGNEIPSEYRVEEGMEEERNGVRVVRVPLHPRRSGALDRVRNYLSFWRNANRRAHGLEGGYDVVLGYQFSPVMQVDPGLVYAREHGVGMLLYCFDLWPASLMAGGFGERSLPFKWMRRVSKRIYSEADRIAVTSPLFDEYFRGELGLEIPDSVYLPQYADDAFLSDRTERAEGFDLSKINLTFAGNVGKAQSVDTIVKAAALVDDSRVVFHIVGSGSMLDECKRLAGDLGVPNVVFHGRHPVEEMPAFYASSDAMLVTLDDSPMAHYTLPRKVTTYLAAGRPVLAALSGETERVVSDAGCGLSCATGDAEGLARIVREFASMDPGAREELGARARGYYAAHFTKEGFFETLEDQLEQLAEERR